MDNEKYLKNLYEWVSLDSILVIDAIGQLRRLYCPFNVICLVEFPDIPLNDKVAVDAIKMTISLKEVYVIKGKAYFIIYFRIIP